MNLSSQELLYPTGSALEYVVDDAFNVEQGYSSLNNITSTDSGELHQLVGGGAAGGGEDQGGFSFNENDTFLDPSWFNRDPHVENFQKVIQWMNVYFLPFLILVGLVGNSLSVCVFILSHLRRLSSSVYLAALAVADAGFLLCTFIEWCSFIGFQFSHKNGWCQILNYLRNVWSFLSVWYVVSFTVERYIAVCRPFQRQKFCTTKRAKTIVLSLAVLAAVIYNWTAWTMGSITFGETTLCSVLPQFQTLETRLAIVDTLLTLLIPFITISALNIRIIYAVFKLHRDRRSMDSAQSCNGTTTPRLNGDAHGVPSTQSTRYTNLGVLSTSSTHSNTLNTRRRYHNSQVKVTKMLVLVSSIFLVLNLPSHALRLYAFTTSLTQQINQPTMLYIQFQRLFQYLNYTNFAINFFLYNTCGRNFRHALRHLGKKIRYNIQYKCFRRKYPEDDIAIVVPVKRKPTEEDINGHMSGQHNMSIHRCHSSQSGSRSQKGSKGSKVEMRATAVQMRSHHSHNSCHSYHSREISHHSREYSHHSKIGRDFSHHSRYASSCSEVDTSSCSHRSLHRCKPL